MTTTGTVPSTDDKGLPLITTHQAATDLVHVKRMVVHLMERATERLAEGDVVQAFGLLGDAEYQVAWMRDRLAITEGGVLKR